MKPWLIADSNINKNTSTQRLLKTIEQNNTINRNNSNRNCSYWMEDGNNEQWRLYYL